MQLLPAQHHCARQDYDDGGRQRVTIANVPLNVTLLMMSITPVVGSCHCEPLQEQSLQQNWQESNLGGGKPLANDGYSTMKNLILLT